MKILFISNLFPPHYLGGYEVLCQQVCEDLEKKGHLPVVLTSVHGIEEKEIRSNGERIFQEEQNRADSGSTIRVFRLLKLYLPFDRPPDLYRWRRRRAEKYNRYITATIIEREKPDVIFMWSQLRLTLGSARASQNAGIPIAYTFNDEHVAGFVPASFSLKPRLFIKYVVDNLFFRSIFLHGVRFDNATCISKILKENLNNKGVSIHDATVIYQGIPIEKFPQKAAPGEIKNPARLLYVGQIHPYKGVHTLIDAVTLIREWNQKKKQAKPEEVKVSIVGKGDPEYEAKLKEMASRSGVQIDFTGKVDHAELPAIYREHDIFIFPSTWQEPFGLTHLEAMASGTPIISTVDGGQGEFIEDGKNAIAFEKENPHDLAKSILFLIHNPDVSRDIAVRGRSTVENRFTVDRYVNDLETFLRKAARGG